MGRRKQELGILIVSILIWIGAVLSIAGALFAFFMGGTLNALGLSIGLADFSSYVVSAAFITLIIAIAYAVLGGFLWLHNKWAWYITFILIVLGLVAIIPSMFVFSPIMLYSIILPVIELIALLHKDSMSACKVNVLGYKGW